MEKTNFRYLTEQEIPEPIDFACADVSFISLEKVLPPARALLRNGAQMVCLVKPQFEAGRELVGKNGVVRDPKVQEAVLNRISAFCEEIGFTKLGHTDSPILGAKGNKEFLLWIRKEAG
jgi:23S rRNA (cytidine1920-2'-O)/16S rRNA (cytidine1409-2'-O)-methyltransferase